MKELEKYIEINKKYLEDLVDKFEKTDPTNIKELERIKTNIDNTTYYIMGLQDAKHYIENEEVNK